MKERRELMPTYETVDYCEDVRIRGIKYPIVVPLALREACR
jgi:hypothetical protein